MHYKIADVILCSQISLPSFSAFLCEPADADVTLGITEEPPPAGQDTVIRAGFVVRTLADGWYFHTGANIDVGLRIGGDYTELKLMRRESRDTTEPEEWFVRVALECLLIRRGYLSLHAACVELDGEAIAFSGPSGIGKSSRAGAWVNALGAALVSGDRPLIRIRAPEAFGVPWDGKEGCFRSVHYPLKAICEVRRSNSVYVRRMTAEQRRRFLMQQCFVPMWDTDTAAVQIMNIARFVSRARIVRVFCGPGTDDAKALRQILDQNKEYTEAPEMKAKKGFILRQIADENILMPIGDTIAKFDGTVLLNDVSAFIWKKLQTPVAREDLLIAILDEYDVDEATAAADLDTLLEKFRSYGVIEDM